MTTPDKEAVFTEIRNLLTNASLEVTPKSAADFGDFSTSLAPQTRLFITHLPGSAWDNTVSTAIDLVRQNMRPVLHIAARSLQSKTELEQGLERLFSQTKNENCDFLLIGGGSKEQAGPFSSSVDILHTELFSNIHGAIYFAGHPEGSPDISDSNILKSLEQKNAFALLHQTIDFHLVTQFCFLFQPIEKWLDVLLNHQNKFPVSIGIPGIASLKTLYNHAKACGIGNSIHFISKQMRRISLLHRQNPHRLIYDIALYNISKPRLPVTNLHLYPFGGIAKNLEWRQQILENPLMLDSKDGFKIDL